MQRPPGEPPAPPHWENFRTLHYTSTFPALALHPSIPTHRRIPALAAGLLLLACAAPFAASQAVPDSLRRHRPAAPSLAPTQVPDSAKTRRGAAPATPDTTGRRGADTSAAAPDSLGRMSTPSLVGTLDRFADSSTVRTSDDLHWIDYRYLGGILETFPGVFLRDQESEGQYSQATFEGVDWRAVSVTANGRRLNDPATGVFNLYHFTPEYADRIEVVTGPRAFLYGFNSTGGAVNLVTKNYNSNKPFTKFNYSEGAYGFSNVDGTFSQNISRKVNVTLGFQHQTTDGRFVGEADDAWNTREKIRYNISREINLIFSHYMTSARTEMNGGVNLPASTVLGGATPFDNAAAKMNQDSTYEKLTEHDFDVSLVGTFLGDTADVTDLTFYYSHAKREFREREDPYHLSPPGVASNQLTTWTGARLTQDFATAFQHFNAGGNIELRRIDASPNLSSRQNVVGAVWAKEELDPDGPVAVALFGRLDTYIGKEYSGVGADAKIRLGPWVSLFGGVSMSYRVPNYQELYWSDSTVVRTGSLVAEHHYVAEAGVTAFTGHGGSIRIGLFHRSVNDPITFGPYYGTSSPFPGDSIANGPSLHTTGASVHVDIRVHAFSLEGNLEYVIQKSGGATLEAFPKFSGSGGLYYRNRLVNDRLELKTGFRGRFTTPYEGVVFNPEIVAYMANRGTPLGTSASVDFFLIGHIGDAYIHFMWENIAGIRYYGTPYYPGGERAIRFGISWEFMN